MEIGFQCSRGKHLAHGYGVCPGESRAGSSVPEAARAATFASSGPADCTPCSVGNHSSCQAARLPCGCNCNPLIAALVADIARGAVEGPSKEWEPEQGWRLYTDALLSRLDRVQVLAAMWEQSSQQDAQKAGRILSGVLLSGMDPKVQAARDRALDRIEEAERG